VSCKGSGGGGQVNSLKTILYTKVVHK
jgi:hypothetical protein